MSRSETNRCVRASVMAAFVLGVGACSSGGVPTQPLAEWRTEFQAVCTDFGERLADRQFESGEPTTPAETVEFYDRMIPLNDEYTAALLDVGLPDEQVDDAEQLRTLLEELADLTVTARDAAERSDADTFSATLDLVNAHNASLADLAARLDIPKCIAS